METLSSWFVRVALLSQRISCNVHIYCTNFTTQKGLIQKKGKFAFKARVYTLNTDGKLYSAKYDQPNVKKHILDLGPYTSFNPANKSDLIVTGQKEGFVNGFRVTIVPLALDFPHLFVIHLL